ncbi:helix-turn-helix domain-containing protein [Bacillus sp. REN10]|uniref:helix-turn-helix domain-containing protein n=1 Tax=Bacillus sp. REN10 TaxID=2782541 RepID=UPI00193B3979|nr:helix-turn-helix domain-containing protein [Bacillus sp. REN10]
MNILENVIGVQDAADLWGLSADHVKKLCRDELIQAKKIGKTYVILKDQPNPKKGLKIGDADLEEIKNMFIANGFEVFEEDEAFIYKYTNDFIVYAEIDENGMYIEFRKDSKVYSKALLRLDRSTMMFNAEYCLVKRIVKNKGMILENLYVAIENLNETKKLLAKQADRYLLDEDNYYDDEQREQFYLPAFHSIYEQTIKKVIYRGFDDSEKSLEGLNITVLF